MIVTPGVIEAHAHFLSPQQSWHALAGGCTTMIGMSPGPHFDTSCAGPHTFGRLIQAAGGVFVPDAQMVAEMARYRASLHEVGNGVAQIAKQMTQANRRGQGAVGGTSAEFTELRLAQMRGLARFILDSADEIDLLLRRRRDAMQLQATAALREFAHAAE